MANKKLQQRIDRAERWNWRTHAGGFVLSILGGAVLPWYSYHQRGSWIFISCLIFVLSLAAVYLCSALSHKIIEPARRDLFRRLDQAFIYILIVATFTPFAVVYLNNLWWHGMMGLMWLVAIVGFVSKMFFAHRVDRVAVWIYLLLGWTPALGGMFNTSLLPAALMWLVAMGGVFYSAGTIFLINDYRRWYFHAIWHLFVIAGSATHYLALLCFV